MLFTIYTQYRLNIDTQHDNTDLLRKSMDLFLYDRDLRHERVKRK